MLPQPMNATPKHNVVTVLVVLTVGAREAGSEMAGTAKVTIKHGDVFYTPYRPLIIIEYLYGLQKDNLSYYHFETKNTIQEIQGSNILICVVFCIGSCAHNNMTP